MILTVTVNPSIDESTTVERVEPDRKLRCEEPRYEAGGGGLNVSRAVRNLGGESTAIWTSGGPTGQLLHDLLEREGVVDRPVEIDGLTRTNLIVLEKSTGRQYRFGMPGPRMTEEEGRRVIDEVRRTLESGFGARGSGTTDQAAPSPTSDPRPPASAFVVASGSLAPDLPEDFYARLASIVNEHGGRLIVDTVGAAMKRALEQGVHLIKPNIHELAMLTDRRIEDDGDVRAAAEQIIKAGGAEIVVASLGAGGAMYVADGECERFTAPTVRIVSRVGAGDSMVAGIVYSLSRGWSVREAVRFGVASGAAAVMTAGTELCRGDDARRLYEQMK